MILDLGIALFLNYFANLYFGYNPYHTPVSFASALIMDIDFIIYWIRNDFKTDKYSYEHRDLFHYLYAFYLLSIVFFYIQFQFGVIWLIGVTWHFGHDSYEAWGTRLFYPVYKGYVTFRPDSPKVFIKDKAEQRRIVDEYGDDNWATRIDFWYFVQVVVLMLGTAMLCHQLGHPFVGAIATVVEMIMASCWACYCSCSARTNQVV